MIQLLEEINTRLIKVEVTRENTVIPRIQALAEGVSAINDLKKAQQKSRPWCWRTRDGRGQIYRGLRDSSAPSLYLMMEELVNEKE